MSKILIVAPYSINTPHFETELEIAQKHLDSGDEVGFLVCDATLKSCDVNPRHKKLVCAQCVGRRKNGLKLLNSPVTLSSITSISAEQKPKVDQVVSQFGKGESLQNIYLENFDIGYGVLSSIISSSRESSPNFSESKPSKTAHLMLESAASMYFTILDKLAESNIDRVYVFNARFGILRAVLRACQASKIECLVHEKGSTLSRYTLYANCMPHDRQYYSQRINQSWALADPNIREKVGSSFFADSRNAISHSWVSFTKTQEQGRLPEDWDSKKTNIVIFNSSEDEFAAIGKEWKDLLYESQESAVTRIIEAFHEKTLFHFYLRVHPNLSGLVNSQLQKINSMNYPNISVIPANSKVSSYALLDEADKVITFGSTMGLEATYWGVPSILVGQALYKGLDAVYEPDSHDEVIRLLMSDLPSKVRLPAIKYGHYARTFGIEFQYYKAKGIYSGRFKGKAIRSSIPIETIFILRQWAYTIFKWARKKLASRQQLLTN